jgi:hypothetical protein
MKIRTWFLAASVLFAATAWADDVLITLDSDTLTALPGQTVTFSGSIFNEDSSTVDLNGIDVTLNGMLFQIDLTPFFFGPPTVGASNPPFDTDTGDFQLFSVTVDDPYDAAYGVESGSVTILGGVEVGNVYDPTQQNPLGSTKFNVDVDVVVTPEPSTLALMLTAVFGGLGFAALHGFSGFHHHRWAAGP